MTLIAKTDELAAFCERQAKAEFVTVDTEFMRDRTYWPVLCLVQVGGPEETVAIDPMAEGIDLAPLFALMANPEVLKVFHAARQDIEIFVNLTGKVPAPIFDSQVAAMVCGFGEAASYETLASKLGGAHIDKSARFTDWSHRPLSERQLRYALADVGPLRIVYEKLAARLKKTARASWLDEEMAALTDPALYRLDPAFAWKRLKLRSNNRRMLALAHALATWRESTAQKRDLPRSRVLRDESLLEIAAHAPQNVDDLARTRGLGKGFAESKFGGEILAVVEGVMLMPESDYPKPEPRREPPQGIGPLTDLLRVLLKLRSEENDVAARLVADAEDLELLAADDHADVRALTGWRHEIFGRDAIDLKHGRLALTAAGKRIKLVRSDAAAATQAAS
ncbi:MAG TPA: ribonuclease D [Stellaceae bacterium]|jgi:ribonuclease D|nr:ribonuclease D [Stellaceae bacterium]